MRCMGKPLRRCGMQERVGNLHGPTPCPGHGCWQRRPKIIAEKLGHRSSIVVSSEDAGELDQAIGTNLAFGFL